jgi:hypothetical protein
MKWCESSRAQEIQVTPAIRLKDVYGMQARVATVRDWRRTIRFAATLEFGLVDQQIEPAIRGVEPDAIAVTHERNRPAGRSLG